MDITIDTTHPLNARDRAMLLALLDVTDTTRPAPPAGHNPNGAAAAAARITGQMRAPGAAPLPGASARLPISQQPGVSSTESVREDDTTPE